MTITEAKQLGYTHYPHKAVYRRGETPRPPCDSCGPFASKYLRVQGRDEYGAIYICSACDREE